MALFAKEDVVLTQRVDAVAGQAAPKPEASTPEDDRPSSRLLSLILDSLENDKAEDVIPIPLTGKSEMADFMVIASGRSTRQVISLSEKLVDRVKAEIGQTCRMEGKETGDWVLIDCGDVVVHIFRPEVRDFYQLEKMWMPSGTAAAGA